LKTVGTAFVGGRGADRNAPEVSAGLPLALGDESVFPPKGAEGTCPASSPEKSAPHGSKRSGSAPGPWNHRALEDPFFQRTKVLQSSATQTKKNYWDLKHSDLFRFRASNLNLPPFGKRPDVSKSLSSETLLLLRRIFIPIIGPRRDESPSGRFLRPPAFSTRSIRADFFLRNP